MAQTASMRAASDKTANIEYTIYTFQRDPGGKNQQRWNKHDSMSDMDQALKKAQSLFDSGNFSKVEIKQKYTDPKNHRTVDTTLKILERKEKRTIGAGLLALLAAIGGGIAFAVTYFLTGN